MSELIEQINSVLPQTQCGLCEYAGCKPYAEAIVNQHAEINRCPPGGIKTLKKLAEITNIDATPYIDEMEKKYKPPSIAVIREAECIGCTKCVQACPVDAIIGSSKQMHAIIASECTGCELCLPACPVDCIDMLNEAERSEEEQRAKSLHAKKRYEFYQQRQKLSAKKPLPSANPTALNQTVDQRQQAIQAALLRVKGK